jgi:sensor histidine kinase YesM
MILLHSTTSEISLEEELKILALYLELEKLRLGERLNYSIDVSNRLHPEQICIPFMILQPYLENAIKHGIAPLEGETGMVRIHFDQADNYLTCTIDDNGIGIRASAQQGNTSHPEHRSLGISITQSRIDVLNAMQKDKIRLEITDKKEAGSGGQGTIVRVHFPILTE